MHDESAFVVGTEKGRMFLNARKELQSDFLSQRENEDLQDMGLQGTSRAVSSLCCPGIFQCAQLQVGDSSK